MTDAHSKVCYACPGVGQFEAALLNQDTTAANAAIGKLKGPYRKLFAKFG